MHQPVLLLSEEVNFHASGWTMWTARFCSSNPRRVHSLTATKGGHKPTGRKKFKKKIMKETERRERQRNLGSKTAGPLLSTTKRAR